MKRKKPKRRKADRRMQARWAFITATLINTVKAMRGPKPRVWLTHEGKLVRINKMHDMHLANAIKQLERDAELRQQETIMSFYRIVRMGGKYYKVPTMVDDFICEMALMSPFRFVVKFTQYEKLRTEMLRRKEYLDKYFHIGEAKTIVWHCENDAEPRIEVRDVEAQKEKEDESHIQT